MTSAITPQTPSARATALRLTEQARGLLARGEDGRAMELLERALVVDARVPYAYYFLAQTHERAGRLDLAHSFLDRAEQLLASEPYWLAEVRTLRGVVYEDQGRENEARRAYRDAIAVWPASARAAEALARLDAHAGTRGSEPR